MQPNHLVQRKQQTENENRGRRALRAAAIFLEPVDQPAERGAAADALRQVERAWESHLKRAKWMTEHGYRHLLRGGAPH